MSKITIIQCDVCGVEKKESNHWWMLSYIEKKYMVKPLYLQNTIFQDWKILYLCSEQCLVSIESKIRQGKLT